MVHILFICNEYPPASHGGIGTFVQTLGRELLSQGQQVFVIGYDSHVTQEIEENDSGVHVWRIPMIREVKFRLGNHNVDPSGVIARIQLSQRVQKLVTQQQIHVVESYDWSGPLWFAPNCPLIVRLHGASTAYAVFEGKRPDRLLKYFEKRNLLLANHLVAVSNHMRKVTLSAYSMTNRECDVIYNGVDTNLFRPTTQSPEANRVLFVGKVHPRKGIRELFSAWELVVKARPSAKLYIIGERPPENELVPYTDGLSLDRASIEFTGFIPHAKLTSWYGFRICLCISIPSGSIWVDVR